MSKRKVPEIRFVGFSGEWEEYELGKKVEFYSGLTYSPNDILKGKGTLVLRSSNVKGGQIVKEDNVFVDSRVINCDNVEQGDIIVVVRNGSRSLIGKHAQIQKEMKNTVIGAFMTGIHSQQSNFINALLNTTQFTKEVEKNLGATINQITTGAFKKMIFMFSTSEEQTKIGNYFQNLDTLIDQKEKKNQKLKQLKKAMLDKMFPKEGESVPEIRFEGFSGDWEEKTLDDLCSIITKQTGFDYSATIKPSLLNYNTDNSYSFIQNKDFEGTNINLKTDFYIPKNIAEKFRKILIDKPSILISISGKIGNVGLYQFPIKSFIGGAVGICKLINKSDGLVVLYNLISTHGQNYFQSLIKASSHSNITVYDIRKIKVKIPSSNEEKHKIENYFQKLDKLLILQQKELEKLKNIKKASLDKMFV